MSHLKTFAKGVLLGGLVGVIYGFFNAPKKGGEMQREAKKTVSRLVKRGKILQKKAVPKIKKVVMKAKKLEKKVLSKGKRIVKKAKTTAKKYKKGKKK